MRNTLTRLKQKFEDRERAISNDISHHVRVRIVVTGGLTMTVVLVAAGQHDYAFVMSTITNLLWIWD